MRLKRSAEQIIAVREHIADKKHFICSPLLGSSIDSTHIIRSIYMTVNILFFQTNALRGDLKRLQDEQLQAKLKLLCKFN